MPRELNLSAFGERFTRNTGALELMDDLGQAMSGDSDALMLGGGNPGKVAAVTSVLKQALLRIAGDDAEFNRMVANYAHPKGEGRFRRALAQLLKSEYGWPIGEEHIALTGGSQSAFFMLFNLFGGYRSDGTSRRVLLPVTPEYVGYADLGLSDGLFDARRPAIEDLGDDYFKYRLDLEGLQLDDAVAAVCVSRPTNPTGNVLTDSEMRQLDRLSRDRGVPLIIDAAYGAPFPDITFVDAEPLWNDNVILCLSLSKFGLPAVRCGIVIAAEPIVSALTKMTAVLSLAVGSVGPSLTGKLVESGEILRLSRSAIMPYYRDKAMQAAGWLRAALAGLPFKIHKPEGAIFLWLWFPGLPITNAELYRRLKAAGVLVLSGHYFFPGLEDDWAHRHECLRVSFALDEHVVREGVRRIAAEVRRAFDV
jgi:valine--pyruvate aminotransferase